MTNANAFSIYVANARRQQFLCFVAGVAQSVRAPVCGTGSRRFNSGHSPHFFVPVAHFLIDVTILYRVAEVSQNTAVICCVDIAGVAKLVDAPDLGSGI